MTLRILGGKFRGRLLKSPKGETRPTTALVRKAVFDILRPHLEGTSFLDLFAGSGAMGIEALSQGASCATFVESNREALHVLRANLEALDIEATVLPLDAEEAVRRLKTRFHVVYADPPYRMKGILERLLALLDARSLVEGYLFLEEGHPAKLRPKSLKHLRFLETRRYGMSVIHLFEDLLPEGRRFFDGQGTGAS